MSNYHPKGFIVMYRKRKEFGTEEVHFQFDGAQDYNDLREWAETRAFTYEQPTIKPVQIYGAGRGPGGFVDRGPVCPTHGAGKWVVPNKGRGKHRFYCAHKTEEDEYCGKKIG